jgi:hypothetical protein
MDNKFLERGFKGKFKDFLDCLKYEMENDQNFVSEKSFIMELDPYTVTIKINNN